MEKINLDGYLERLKVSNQRIEQWKLIGEELKEVFGKNLYWVFWKEGMTNEKAVEALDACKREGVLDVRYFLGILRKKGVVL